MCRMLMALLAGPVALPAMADDARYFRVDYDDLTVTEGEIPPEPTLPTDARRERAVAMGAYVVLDAPGEAYVGDAVAFRPQRRQRRALGDRGSIAIRVTHDRDVTGSMFVPGEDWSAMSRLRFRIPARQASSTHRVNFLQIRRDHYQRLLERRIPGGAWFRFQEWQTAKDLGVATTGNTTRTNRRSTSDWDRTFDLFTGSRAISENLALDRLLNTVNDDPATIDISSLKGITIPAVDWKELNEGTVPDPDPLAKLIPADQPALLFSSFGQLMTLIDEADFNGTPLVDLLESRVEDARSRERYERQLCLQLDAFTRAFGDQVIQNVAITASDPYLRTGTDLAVLLQSQRPELLTAAVRARQSAACRHSEGCQQVTGRVDDVEYVGAVSPNRQVCSYLVSAGDTVLVTNSLYQVQRFAAVKAGQTESMASLPEYTFFRNRYPRNNANETAFLMITDAAIRRWCGPKWRIGKSRRTRAAAIMSDEQARHLSDLAGGTVQSNPLQPAWEVHGLGTLQLTGTGVASSTYGNLEFLTPISELQFSKISQSEFDAYNNWRRGYERNWQRAFDPIGLSVLVRDNKLAADLTVMPLIQRSDYRQLIEQTRGAAIAPESGDRHEGTLMHYTFSINRESSMMKSAGSFLQRMSRAPEGSVWGWLGESASVYAEKDEFWFEMAKAESRFPFLLANAHRLPLALRAEVRDSLQLAVFLVGLRAAFDQAAPGLTEWENREHNGQAYVRIGATEASRNLITNVSPELAIYYVATPEALTVTLNEQLVKAAIDREKAKKDGESVDDGAPKTRPWLGENVAIQTDMRLVEFLEAMFGGDYQAVMQARSWANIPILNEWRSRYPDVDPNEFHSRHWQTRLRCPGGGEYVWNNEFKTMESTVYGHPARPKTGPKLPKPLTTAGPLNVGVTFENDGLRARAEFQRTNAVTP